MHLRRRQDGGRAGCAGFSGRFRRGSVHHADGHDLQAQDCRGHRISGFGAGGRQGCASADPRLDQSLPESDDDPVHPGPAGSDQSVGGEHRPGQTAKLRHGTGRHHPGHHGTVEDSGRCPVVHPAEDPSGSLHGQSLPGRGNPAHAQARRARRRRERRFDAGRDPRRPDAKAGRTR